MIVLVIVRVWPLVCKCVPVYARKRCEQSATVNTVSPDALYKLVAKDVHHVDVAVSSAIVRNHQSIFRCIILVQRLAIKHKLDP